MKEILKAYNDFLYLDGHLTDQMHECILEDMPEERFLNKIKIIVSCHVNHVRGLSLGKKYEILGVTFDNKMYFINDDYDNIMVYPTKNFHF